MTTRAEGTRAEEGGAAALGSPPFQGALAAQGGPGSAEPVEAGRADAPARPRAATIALRFALVAALVAFDLWSKAAVFAWLEGPAADRLVTNSCCDMRHERLLVLGDHVPWFAFMLSRNPGAAFGGFSEWPHLLVAGRIAAALFLIWLVVRTPQRRKWFSLALVLVLSGALGNLYDNLRMPKPPGHPYGLVRDFIDVYFGIWQKHFPTFNFADSCITVGAILLLLTGLGREGNEAERVEPAS